MYVQSLEDSGGRWQISADGGGWSQWTRQGREIVFLADDGPLMAVEVTVEPLTLVQNWTSELER